MRVLLRLSLLAMLFGGVSVALAVEPLPLKRAVDLALSHGNSIGTSIEDEQRAYATYRETKGAFLPQLAVGSGLGATWGFPLSLEGAAPSILNVNAQSSLINPALRQFSNAAKSEWQATLAQSKEQRLQVMQETALDYVELSRWERLIDHLREEQAEALKMENVEDQRIREGVDSPLLRNQARLTTARAHLRVTEAQGSIDVLRDRLSQLTGLPAASIVTEFETIPALPEINPEEDAAVRAVNDSPVLEATAEHAAAARFRARGEVRAMWPTVDFASQYARLSTFNNYENYFKTGSFQRNNATIGVVVRFPFLSLAQRARAEGAKADLVHATKQVQITRNQVSAEALRLQRSVEQLQAAQEVAGISYEIAKSNLDTVNIRLDSGTATLHEAVEARVQNDAQFDALQDADFQLQRAQIDLMAATNQLEAWINARP